METKDYILQHREDDVRQLALKQAGSTDIDMPFALQQIAGWQAARRKLPSWAALEGISYPPHLSMEQCSSEATARYKQAIAERLTGGEGLLVDLTGGFGVDCAFMAQAFHKAVYVERQEHLCDIARQNFKVLGLGHVEVAEGDSMAYLHQLEKARMIYLDPARRNEHGAKTYAISDCTPDILSIQEELLAKAEWVMVKLSPMLDWHRAVEELPSVCEVHIVSVSNECKELLLVMSREHQQAIKVYCANDSDVFEYTPSLTGTGTDVMQPVIHPRFLYEPNASIMKAGCFGEVARRYQARALGKNSHLFISADFIGDFPGRIFQISAISSMNKAGMKQALGNIRQANIAVRNFPMSVADLRKRLKLADGGDHYLFATTTEEGKHILIVCKKP